MRYGPKKTVSKHLKRGDHPLHSLLPRYKDSSARLRNRSSIRPNINTERFEDSFFNRLIFNYYLEFYNLVHLYIVLLRIFIVTS